MHTEKIRVYIVSGAYYIAKMYYDKLQLLLLWAAALLVRSQHSEQTDHRDFQYNSVVDPATGRYNFAYDTGHDDDIAHTLHMQYRDADGVVRGRYGYTDPRGKLRMVEYEAGPNGFIARGDVGPDLFPHGQAPAAPTSLEDSQPVRSSSYSVSGNDFNLDPAPVQMAGWNPEADPIEQPISGVTESTNSVVGEGTGGEEDPGNQFTTANVTSYNALDVYGPELGFFSGPAPRVAYYPVENTNTERESDAQDNNQNTADLSSQPLRENPDLNVYNIDVDPNDIRATARGGPVRRSADTRLSQDQTRTAHALPYSYRNYRYAHDHDAETRSRYQHDHAAERRRYYASRRYTHDHDAENRRYRSRYTHDHDAENRYRSRYTHDHDAERTVPSRSTHDHSAERRAYLRRTTYNYPRRIFYRDSHSMEPHEHWDNPVYQNYRDRQHADRHLYARSRNYVVPPTANPRQLRYVPSDKYHDKVYYWTNE